MRIARTVTATLALTLVGFGLVSCSNAPDTAEDAANAYLAAVSEGDSDKVVDLVKGESNNEDRVSEALTYFGLATGPVAHDEAVLSTGSAEPSETPATGDQVSYTTQFNGEPTVVVVNFDGEKWTVNPSLGSIAADGKSIVVGDAEPDADGIAWVLPGVYSVSVDGGPATAVTVPDGSMDVKL